MKLRLTSFALLIALFSAFTFAPLAASAATKDKTALKNLPVSGTLADGGTFTGKVSITKFSYDTVEGLKVSGVLNGTARQADGVVTKDISQRFTTTATLNETANASTAGYTAQASCQILFLDIGPIFLDLLGLQVDLSQIVLDITAVSGAGNLLGNLLCAVAGLLDPNGFLTDLIGGLTQLLDFLNQLNNLLR